MGGFLKKMAQRWGFAKSNSQKATEQRAALAQEKANKLAEAALVPKEDNTQARDAMDALLRKRAKMKGIAGTMTTAARGAGSNRLLGQ